MSESLATRGDLVTAPVASAESGRAEGLEPRIGVAGITFSVIGYLAPLSAMAGTVTLVIGYGNGLGTPLTYLVTGVLLLLFAVGFMALVRHVARPGAFYSYIAASLGRRTGLGASGISLALYGFSMISICTFGGLQIRPLVASMVGVTMPWWLYSLAFLTFVGVSSYRGIELNVRLIAAVVTAEVIVVVGFNIVTLFRGGPDGYMVQSFSLDSFTSGSIPVAILFAVCTVAGFEATAIFREEAREPNKSIPRATYIIVIGSAVFYAIASWCLIIAMGNGAVEGSAADPTAAFSAAIGSMFGNVASDVVLVLTITSVLASALSITNVASRYTYSLGVDRVLPRALDAVHPRFGSPYRALLAACAFAGIGIGFIAISGLGPVETFSVISGVAVLGFEVLLFLVSLSVVVFFRGKKTVGESLWATLVAPLLSAIAFGALIVYTAAHVELLTGAPSALTPVLVVIFVGAFVLGFGYASWAAWRKPEVFARIGRAVE